MRAVRSIGGASTQLFADGARGAQQALEAADVDDDEVVARLLVSRRKIVRDRDKPACPAGWQRVKPRRLIKTRVHRRGSAIAIAQCAHGDRALRTDAVRTLAP